MQTETVLILLFSVAVAVAIAVVAVFRSLGVPRRLSVLLEGESLLNDGTAIVFFTLSLSLAIGASVTPGQLVTDFFKVVGFGGLIGAALGLAVSQLIKQIDDAMIEITLTTIAAQESQWARRHLLLTEKNDVIESFRQGILGQEVDEKLLADIDARLLRLESSEAEHNLRNT